MTDPAHSDVESDLLEARLGSHIGEIMAAARKAAAQLRAEIEAAATRRAAEIETASARRAHAVRMGAEAEAERLRAQAIAMTEQYLAASKRRIDEFAADRTRRMSEVADQLTVSAEALLARWSRSEEIARQLDELRVALAAAMDRIAVEAGREEPELPELALPSRKAEATAVGGAAEAGEPEPEREPEARARTLQDRLARATSRAPARDAAASEPAAPLAKEEPTGDG